MKSVTSIQYDIAIFVAGFSLMVIEITSSRIVAPIIGSSIFTWTSVIGVTLLGLSIGSFVGGEIADRYVKSQGKKVVALAFLFAAALVYAIIPLSKSIRFVLNASFHILSLAVIVCAGLFLFPSIAIGMLSPILFKLYTRDSVDLGKKYGLLSGLWSLGSIVGVFATGFYFITTIGSSGTIYLVAALLVAPFFFFYSTSIKRSSINFEFHRAFMVAVSVVIAVLVYCVFVKPDRVVSKTVFQEETAYYDLKVVNYDLYPQFGYNRILFLDIDSHSIQTEYPSKAFYTDIYPAFSAFSNTLNRIYVIGAGAYTLPINLRKQYPNATITVGEIDPELEKVGSTYFGIDAYNIRTEVGDARVKFSGMLANTQAEKYDLIYGDAYNSFISVPWYLLTREFMADIRDHLAPDGLYAINFIGTLEGQKSEMFRSVYRTFDAVFPNNYLFAFGTSTTAIQNITIIGIKNDTLLSTTEVAERLDTIDPTRFLSQRLVKKELLNGGSGITGGIILTDDFSPVESMMGDSMNEYFSQHLPLYMKILR